MIHWWKTWHTHKKNLPQAYRLRQEKHGRAAFISCRHRGCSSVFAKFNRVPSYCLFSYFFSGPLARYVLQRWLDFKIASRKYEFILFWLYCKYINYTKKDSEQQWASAGLYLILSYLSFSFFIFQKRFLWCCERMKQLLQYTFSCLVIQRKCSVYHARECATGCCISKCPNLFRPKSLICFAPCDICMFN